MTMTTISLGWPLQAEATAGAGRLASSESKQVSATTVRGTVGLGEDRIAKVVYTRRAGTGQRVLGPPIIKWGAGWLVEVGATLVMGLAQGRTHGCPAARILARKGNGCPKTLSKGYSRSQRGKIRSCTV